MVQAAGFGLHIALELAKSPIGGRISQVPQTWGMVTDDKWVLDIVSEGYRVPFVSIPPTPMNSPNPPTDYAGRKVLDSEVEAMLRKGAIRQVAPNLDGVVSPFFARPKSTPGKFRPILSVKKVNGHIRYKKFRMVTIKDISLMFLHFS